MDPYKLEQWLDTNIDDMLTNRDILAEHFFKIKDTLIKNDLRITDPVQFQNQFILFCYHNSTRNKSKLL